MFLVSWSIFWINRFAKFNQKLGRMSTPTKNYKELPKIGLSGLTLASMKKHPAIIPIYFFVGAGVALAGWYVYRLAVKSPEVTWSRKRNPEPWNEYTSKQYKLLSSGRDYSAPSPAPNYKE